MGDLRVDCIALGQLDVAKVCPEALEVYVKPVLFSRNPIMYMEACTL